MSEPEGDATVEHHAEKSGAQPAEFSASRRSLMSLAVVGIGGGLACLSLAPGAMLLSAPLRGGSGTKEGSELDASQSGGGGPLVELGALDQFGAEPQKVDLFADVEDAWVRAESVRVGSAWVVEHQGELIALSTVCPHLGCAVDYDPGAGKFKCPCHRSAFDLGGHREEGPSPRDLDRLELEQRDGLVQLRFQRFRPGQSEKVPV